MSFGWGNWLVVLLPMICILGMAFYSKRYVHDMADYLSAGRVARRYVICVGGMEEALGVMLLIQNMEKNYLTGFSIQFWNVTTILVGMFLGLSGWCIYRFRQTRAMTLGQFLEMRYNRSLRVFASVLKVTADILTEIILPAVAARFFIYFFDLPLYYSVFGIEISTYASLMVFTLSIAMFIIFSGGSVALLVADCLQGLLCYPMFLFIVIYALVSYNWSTEIVPVMFDRVPGENFMNPFDVKNMRDFNLFMIFVLCFQRVMNRAIWLGGGSSTSAKDAHEQKMAGVLGTWRGGFSGLMMTVLGIVLIVALNHAHFSAKAADIRGKLAVKVASEVMTPDQQREFSAAVRNVGKQEQNIGVDPMLAQKQNLDTPYFDLAEATLKDGEDSNLAAQKFRTLYYQQIFPVAMRVLMPKWMLGLFILLVVMIMVSTDASRIFLISTAMAQDLVLPFLKNPMKPRHQMMLIKLLSVVVAVIFFVASLLMAQMEYIQLFVTIVGALWTGGAGAVMVFGLYSRFGTTAGAFASLISGAVISVSGMTASRNWADVIYPWLNRRGMIPTLSKFLTTVSKPLNPWIDWKMSAKKFPINAYEILFIAMLASCACYIIFSLITYRKPFNLDRMLHRGEYADDKTRVVVNSWSLKSIFSKLVGINSEYTKSDRAIAYAVFVYTFIYRFFLTFIVVLLINTFTGGWATPGWSMYYLITMLIVPFVVGLISSVWFFIGGVIDMRHLFRDLEARKRDFSDDGRVENKD